MVFDLRTCVVRIESLDGKYIAGTGFVVAEDLAVTCAHVIDALNVKPGEQVRLTFHVGGVMEAEVLVDGWHPEEDVAFLQLGEPLPAEAMPAILGMNVNTMGHSFHAFGYPQIGDIQGVWAEGQIMGQVTDERGAAMLQLRAQEIAPGMSGAPVLDVSAEQVVGMVTLTYQPDEALKFRDAAFAIPAETLRDRCSRGLELMPIPGIPKVLPIGISFQAPPLPTYFVPRPEVSEALITRLTVPQSFTVLVGLGGIGKTCLAVAAIQELEAANHFTDGTFWLDGRRYTNLGTLLVTLGGLLHLDLSQRTLDEQQQAVNYILRGKNALVVVDNFESVAEPSVTVDFLRRLACNVLLTSRVRLPEFEEPLIVHSLTNEAALELFANVSGNESYLHDSEVDTLCNQDLEGHPLAIEMMAALTTMGLNPRELRQYLRESPMDVLDVDSDLLEMKSVVRVLNMSYQRLGPLAQMVLTRASVFAADFDLAGLAALIPDQSRLALAKTIQSLETRSLVQPTGPAAYRLHAVTRQYAYGLLDNRPSFHRRAAQYFLTERGDSLAAVGQYLQAHDEHEVAALTPRHTEDWIQAGRASEALAILGNFTPDRMAIETQCIVHETRGDLQYLLGELDEAIHQYENAIERAVQADSTIRVRLQRKLADVLSRKGEYQEALVCLERGRDLVIDISEANDESALLAVGYGTVLLALERFDDVIVEVQTALDQMGKAPVNPRIAADLYDLLGKVHYFEGEFAESLEQFRSALKLREGASDQQGVIKSYSNLAVVYGGQNRYDEALKANETALEIAEHIGDEVAIATLCMNMTADYIDQGAYKQAIEFSNRALNLSDKMGNVYQLAIIHHNLGDLYKRMGDLELAIAHLTQAIDFAKQMEDQGGMIGTMIELADVYLVLGRVNDALAQGLESLHLIEQSGIAFWRPASLHSLGSTYAAMQRWDEGRETLEEACQIWREREAWMDLCDTLLCWAKLEQAAGQINRGLTLCEEAHTLATKYQADDLAKQASALLLQLASNEP